MEDYTQKESDHIHHEPVLVYGTISDTYVSSSGITPIEKFLGTMIAIVFMVPSFIGIIFGISYFGSSCDGTNSSPRIVWLLVVSILSFICNIMLLTEHAIDWYTSINIPKPTSNLILGLFVLLVMIVISYTFYNIVWHSQDICPECPSFSPDTNISACDNNYDKRLIFYRVGIVGILNPLWSIFVAVPLIVLVICIWAYNNLWLVILMILAWWD
jgi:hypothetical protein